MIESFFTISIYHLNLFSFMLGILWALLGMNSWGNQKDLWGTVILYVIGVALYYFAKSEGWLELLK
jgi:uncharacterized membrane protein YqjE